MRRAVITAGGRIDGEFAAAAGTHVKALAPVRGASMLDRIIDALRNAGVDCIAVVGGDEVRAACAARVERVVAESDSGSANVLRALHAWPGDESFLYATSDLPYVTAEAVADFIERAPRGALSMAVSEIADFSARFDGAPAGFGIALAGERIVNGGLLSIPAASVDRIADLATRLFEARKRPWRMATIASPLAMLRFAFGTLSVARLEALAEKAIAGPAKAVRRCAPELAFDADTVDEYRYACAHR